METALREALARIQRKIKSETRLAKEYKKLKSEIADSNWYQTAIYPQTQLTMGKNRYVDILPYTHTRVVLQNMSLDYINANYMQNKQYIGCIAPIPNSMVDFWHMVWQEQVAVILMLTNFVERGRCKADIYWNTNKAIMFGDIQVTMTEEENVAVGYITRLFSLRRNGIVRNIWHIQLEHWPDHGVLEDLDVITAMLHCVHVKNEHQTNRPILVHCSAGIGRTGTFIAIDVMRKQFLNALRILEDDSMSRADMDRVLGEAIDIKAVTRSLRMERDGSVQTSSQYEMIYEYVAGMLSQRLCNKKYNE